MMPTATPEFALDFIALQKSLRPLRRNATADDGTRYADIGSIWTEIRSKLARHGFSILQWEGPTTVRTLLIHKTGVILGEDINLDNGSADTARYGRRHALMCLLGLVEEPTDAKVPTFQNEPDREVYELIDGMHEPHRTNVLNAIAPLSTAQKLVIFRRLPLSPERIIAEAQRLGGAK